MFSFISRLGRRAAFMAVAALAVTTAGMTFASPAAHAQSVSLGNVTTAQVSCGPLGANVAVNVTGGLSSTMYTAGLGMSLATIPAIFTTSVSGSGSGTITSVPLPLGGIGNVTIPVIASGQTTTVTAAVNCPTLPTL